MQSSSALREARKIKILTRRRSVPFYRGQRRPLTWDSSFLYIQTRRKNVYWKTDYA